MTDLTTRQPPSKAAALADLTLLVRPPGQPDKIRAFTTHERVEAHSYATETNGAVETLP